MFVQVIQGRVADAAAVRAQMDRWRQDLAPGATGWLGSTAGVTEDGTFIALARFASGEAAWRNSGRPEQTVWWEETAKLFDGEPELHDSTHVEVDLKGDPDEAGFVQVMQGRSTDPARTRELLTDDAMDVEGLRPDVLGSVTLDHDGDAWTMALYFTSEDDARAGERKPHPPEAETIIEQLQSLMVGPPSYFDLKDPWLHSPG